MKLKCLAIALIAAVIPALSFAQGQNFPGSSSGSTSPGWTLSLTPCGSNASCTQIKGDLKYVVDATSNSTTTVTCPDCNFTQADVGKTFWATTQGTGAGVGYLIYTTYVCPITTIASVTNATTIVLNLACTASGTGNVAAYWGTKDGAALAALDAAIGCAVVHVPAGVFILDDQPFLVNPPAAGASGCGGPVLTSGITSSVGTPAPALVGDGFGASQSFLVISPDFNWTNCKAITGASLNVCIGGTARTLANLQIWGTGLTSASNSTGCSGAANKILVSASPTSSTIYGVDVSGVCPGASGMRGVELNSFDENFDLGGVQEVGSVACAAHGASSLVFREDDCLNANVAGGLGLVIDSGAQAMDLGSYPMTATQVSGTLQTRGSHLQGGITCLSGGSFISITDFIGVDGASPGDGLTVNSGCTAQLFSSRLGGTSSIKNLGTVISLGGNKLSSVPDATSTGVWLGTGVLSGTCRGTASSSSTLGLYGLGQNSTPACTSTTVNQGAAVQAVPISGSVFTLVVTAGTGCKSGNTCVFTLMKNNAANPSAPVATTLTCSMVGPAATCSDFAHFDIPAIGDTYSVQFTTGATETLANVTATVLAW